MNNRSWLKILTLPLQLQYYRTKISFRAWGEKCIYFSVTELHVTIFSRGNVMIRCIGMWILDASFMNFFLIYRLYDVLWCQPGLYQHTLPGCHQAGLPLLTVPRIRLPLFHS